MFFFKLRLSGERVRAMKMRAKLGIGRLGCWLNVAQAGLSSDAIRDETAAPLTFFVDELQTMCSELTCLAVCRLPCEVAVARRCGAPVVSGRVPPVITPWSGGARESRGALCCNFRAKSPRGEAQTTPWGAESRVSDGSDLNS